MGMNLLTKNLIAQGYTAENHPDYVKIPAGGSLDSKNPLDNIYGGFEYTLKYAEELTFETPCGMTCKGKSCMTNTYYRGADMQYENGNPLIHCPKGCQGCDQREGVLQDETSGVFAGVCMVHPTDREYHYKGSCEEAKASREADLEQKKQEFIAAKDGRACENQMRYNEKIGEWESFYDPEVCAKGHCRAQAMGQQCPILGRKLCKEKGNVYYDVRYEGRDYSQDGTIFEGERFERVIKGRQYFERPILMDIARVFAKQCQSKIQFKVRYNARDYDQHTMYRVERGEIDFHWQIENVRAEKRETRDLMQDLEDIRNGVSVSHESDIRNKDKIARRERRENAKTKEIWLLEKKIRKVGYENLGTEDKRRVQKLLTAERIQELEVSRDKSQQLTIFDLSVE